MFSLCCIIVLTLLLIYVKAFSIPTELDEDDGSLWKHSALDISLYLQFEWESLEDLSESLEEGQKELDLSENTLDEWSGLQREQTFLVLLMFRLLSCLKNCFNLSCLFLFLFLFFSFLMNKDVVAFIVSIKDAVFGVSFLIILFNSIVGWCLAQFNLLFLVLIWVDFISVSFNCASLVFVLKNDGIEGQVSFVDLFIILLGFILMIYLVRFKSIQ